MKFLRGLLIALLMVFLTATPVLAIPDPQETFIGTVTVNGAPAPDDLTVTAKINGVVYGNKSTCLTKSGTYGTDTGSITHGNYTFNVPSDDPATPSTKEGGVDLKDTVNFFVEGVQAVQETTFHSRVVTRVDLSLTLNLPSTTPTATPTPTPTNNVGPVGGGGSAPPPTGPTTTQIDANIMGTGTAITIDTTGKFVNGVQAASDDGKINLKIDKGTIGLDRNGKPLGGLDVRKFVAPPAPPEGKNIIGLAYEFGPSGATFNPPITLEYSYKPEDIPAGTPEQDMVLAYYNGETGKWETVESTVDPVTHKITAKIPHFTIYAIIGNALAALSPAPVAAASPTPTVAAAPSPTAAAQSNMSPSASPSGTPAGGSGSGSFNWTLAGAFGGGLLVAGVLAVVLFRRKKS